MKKSLFFFSIPFLFVTLLVQAQDISVSQNPATESYGQLQYEDGSAITITHSTSQTIIATNSVSCNAAGIHTDNSYFRAFTLADFGITDDFNVTMVEIGVEQATGGSGTQPITVNLWTSSQPFPNGFPGSVTQIGTADINVPDQALTLFQIPVTGTAPAGSELVVEIFTPDGTAGGNSFFIGSNNLGETGPSYILATGCGITVPTPTGSIGFPNMHIVMNVTGETGGGGGEIIFFDDFENYVAGQQVACQNPTNWTTWSNLPCDPVEDAFISTNHAFSGNNSVVIVLNNDLVKAFGPYTSGKWEASWQMYLPTGKSGYFNTLSIFAGAASEWGMQVFLNAGGTGTLDAGGVSAATFNYPNDTWILVQVVVDLDLDQAQFWLNGAMVYQWQWTLGALGQGGSLQLNANDFFGYVATDEMYFDDYKIIDLLFIPVELTSFAASVDNNGNVVLNWATATETNNHMFEIERKAENGEYFTIGYVNGAGTTTEPQYYSFTDKTVETGKYFFRLKQLDFDGRYQYSNEVEVDVNGPLSFVLEQNYPNPFNPSTNIKYSVSEAGNVKLSVYNLIGEEVAVLVNELSQPGFFEVSFDASNLPSGIYLYKLQSANSTQTKKMMLLK